LIQDITQDELAAIWAAIRRSRGDTSVTWGTLPAVHLDLLKTASGSPYIGLHVDANPERGAVIVKTAIEGTEVMPPFAWLFYSAPNNRAAAFDTLESLAEFLAATIAADEVNVVTTEAKAVYAVQESLAKYHYKLVFAAGKRFNVKAQGGDAVLASLEPQPLNGTWQVRLPGSEVVVAEPISGYVGDLIDGMATRGELFVHE
jgi:hypothetical protein